MQVRGPRGAIEDLVQSIQNYRIWAYFGFQNVISRYRRTFLGPLWISLGVIATGLALSFVFGNLFGQTLSEVLPHIMGGIICFYFFVVPLTEGSGTFLGAGGMMKSRAFPLMTYVFLSITTLVITFAHTIVAFYVLISLLGVFILPHWSFVPAIMLIIIFLIFANSLSGLLAARYRDAGFLLPFIGQILFFMTPIFWNPESIEGPRRAILDYNPAYYMLNLTRGSLLGEAPRLIDWAVTAGCAGFAFVLWLFFFGAFRRRIIFWL